MPIRTPSFIIIIFLLLLPASKIFAQQKEDTLVLKSNTPDTSGKNLLALDTAIKKKHNPKIAP